MIVIYAFVEHRLYFTKLIPPPANDINSFLMFLKFFLGTSRWLSTDRMLSNFALYSYWGYLLSGCLIGCDISPRMQYSSPFLGLRPKPPDTFPTSSLRQMKTIDGLCLASGNNLWEGTGIISHPTPQPPLGAAHISIIAPPLLLSLHWILFPFPLCLSIPYFFYIFFPASWAPPLKIVCSFFLGNPSHVRFVI